MKYAILRKDVYWAGWGRWVTDIQKAIHYETAAQCANAARIDVGLSGCQIQEVPK